MTREEFEAIKRRADAATPGPWRNGVNIGGFSDEEHDVFGPKPTHGKAFICNYALKPDAEFIAAARSDVPALVAEVERCQKEVQELSDICKEHAAKSPEFMQKLEARTEAFFLEMGDSQINQISGLMDEVERLRSLVLKLKDDAIAHLDRWNETELADKLEEEIREVLGEE
jgi:hypothetical protein